MRYIRIEKVHVTDHLGKKRSISTLTTWTTIGAVVWESAEMSSIDVDMVEVCLIVVWLCL